MPLPAARSGSVTFLCLPLQISFVQRYRSPVKDHWHVFKRRRRREDSTGRLVAPKRNTAG